MCYWPSTPIQEMLGHIKTLAMLSFALSSFLYFRCTEGLHVQRTCEQQNRSRRMQHRALEVREVVLRGRRRLVLRGEPEFKRRPLQMDLWGLFGCNNPTRHRASSLRHYRFPKFNITFWCHTITFFSPFASSFTFPPHLHLIHCVFHKIYQFFDNCFYCYDYCFDFCCYDYCFSPSVLSAPPPSPNRNQLTTTIVRKNQCQE